MPGTATAVASDWLARKIPGPRAQDIRGAVAELINTGALLPGAQLPTIRALADELGTKVSAVTDAWTMRVARPVPPPRRRSCLRRRGRPVRRVRLGRHAATRACRRARRIVAVRGGVVHSAGRGRTAVQLVAKATGARIVAVEAPGLVRTTKVMRYLDATVHSVKSDADGPLPAALEEALDAGAMLLAFQPSASIPLGSTLTTARRDEHAAILARHPDAWVLEEDPTGPLFESASLGHALPERTVRITKPRPSPAWRPPA